MSLSFSLPPSLPQYPFLPHPSIPQASIPNSLPHSLSPSDLHPSLPPCFPPLRALRPFLTSPFLPTYLTSMSELGVRTQKGDRYLGPSLGFPARFSLFFGGFAKNVAMPTLTLLTHFFCSICLSLFPFPTTYPGPPAKEEGMSSQ